MPLRRWGLCNGSCIATRHKEIALGTPVLQSVAVETNIP
jgi:hypothetical protein